MSPFQNVGGRDKKEGVREGVKRVQKYLLSVIT